LSETDGARAARIARGALERLLHPRPLSPALGDRLERYVALLLDANRRLNLTRVVEPEAVARLHLLDSLAALPLIDDALPARAIDLGSGGGVPAIPLALARPEVHWTLVDSVGKKAAVLREFVDTLGLKGVEVLAERAESIGRDRRHREAYDLCTARACAALPVLVELALPLVAGGGRLVAWKGPLTEADDEMRRGRVAAGQLGGGRADILPTGEEALGDHTFVVVPKVGPTPARFPRKPGEPGRKPLG
jgi:16S rRNA (guanine527-N7)-methyltransferase